MDSIEIFYLLTGQTLFFVVVLLVCLKLASNKHRSSIRQLAEQIRHFKLNQNDNAPDAKDAELLRRQLMERLSTLQARMALLQGIEVKYNDLKVKYKNLQDKQFKLSPMATIAEEDQAGVHPASKTKTEPPSRRVVMGSIDKSSEKINRENERLQSKLGEQRSIIRDLESTLGKFQFDGQVAELKNTYKNQALDRLASLEKHIGESSQNSDQLEKTVMKLRVELAKAKEHADALEQRTGDQSKKYKVSSHVYQDDRPAPVHDAFATEAIANYHLLKKEVSKLRESTTYQRQVIFSLESDMIALRKELQNGQLDLDQQLEKERQLEKLERLLAETEGCVDVLESEVSFLQGKLESISTVVGIDAEKLTDAQQITELLAAAEKSQAMLERATTVRGRLRKIIQLSQEIISPAILERVGHAVLEIIDDLKLPVLLKIQSAYGSVEMENGVGFGRAMREKMVGRMKQPGEPVYKEGKDVFIAYKFIGACYQEDGDVKKSLGTTEDTLSFTLLIANTVIAYIEKRQTNENRQAATHRLVEGVQKNITQMSVQSKYRSDEARNIMTGFLAELNACLNTMNITETQSEFFAEMIKDTKERMDLLFATELVVDTAFADLIDKLKKSSTTLQRR